MRHSKKICLIIPCFNEENRLNLDEFVRFSSPQNILVFVNDGSRDNTLNLLRSGESDFWYVVNLEHNKGKSEAIRQGAIFIRDSKLFEDIDWIGYWDSDLSVPLAEINNYFSYADCFYPKANCIIGSRVKRKGSEIVRSASRHYLGRAFCTLVSYLFSISYYDTQCGAKLMRKELLQKAFDDPFTSKWIFDIELLLRLQESEIIEYPLLTWKEKPGSKINFFTVWWEVLADLLRMKRMNNRKKMSTPR